MGSERFGAIHAQCGIMAHEVVGRSSIRSKDCAGQADRQKAMLCCNNVLVLFYVVTYTNTWWLVHANESSKAASGRRANDAVK